MINHRHPNCHISLPMDNAVSSFTANYGTYNASCQIYGTTPLVTGVIGQQFQFNGTDSYLAFTAGTGEDLGTSDLTLCTRITHETQATPAWLMGQINGVITNPWYMYVLADGKIHVGIKTTNSDYRYCETNATAAPDGTPTGIIATVNRSAGVIKIYINGSEVASTTTSAGSITGSLDSAVQMQFGARAVTGSRLFYKGKIDDTYIFKGLLFNAADAKRFHVTGKAPLRKV